MFKIGVIELFTRGILEGFLFVLANYAFAKKRVIKSPYILSSIILIAFTFAIRMLDINFGVPTILNIICLIFLCVYINKIDLFQAVKGSMITTLIMFVVEAVNVVFLKIILSDIRLDQVLNDPYQKAIAGIPGIVLFGVIIVLLYIKLTKKEQSRCEDGTASE